MFDNKKEPQDIFEGVEPPANLPVGGSPVPASITPQPSVDAGPRLTPPTVRSAPVVASPEPPVSDKIVNDRYTNTGGHLMKTVIIVVIAFAVMGGAALLAYRVMNPSSSNTVNKSGETAGENDDVLLPDGKGEGSNTTPDVPDVKIVLDTDGDGLTNDEEKAAGTNIAKPDTDGDLLGDREEVQVYGTDPLRTDTDGDTFSDGQEVQSGYNPNGPGKILELPTP